MFRAVEDALFPLLMRHQRAWVIQQFAPVLSGHLDLSFEPVLIHGDVGSSHVLYSPREKRFAGVIDFGTPGLGDAATDIAALIDTLGESLVAELLPVYPALPALLDRARFLMGAVNLQWALSGSARPDQALLLAPLGGARDVQPVGAPWSGAGRRRGAG